MTYLVLYAIGVPVYLLYCGLRSIRHLGSYETWIVVTSLLFASLAWPVFVLAEFFRWLFWKIDNLRNL